MACSIQGKPRSPVAGVERWQFYPSICWGGGCLSVSISRSGRERRWNCFKYIIGRFQKWPSMFSLPWYSCPYITSFPWVWARPRDFLHNGIDYDKSNWISLLGLGNRRWWFLSCWTPVALPSCVLWWSKLPCWTDPCGRTLSATSSQKPVRN